MTETKLDLPYLAVIPYNILIDNDLNPAAKIFYGCLVGLSKKEGYCYASDEQLAEQHSVDVRTIKRWLKSLEEKGFISRHTKNVPYKTDEGKLIWRKKRKIYTGSGFSRKESEGDKTEQDKIVPTSVSDKIVPTSVDDKNVPYKVKTSKEEIPKEKSTPSGDKNKYGSDGLVEMTKDQHDKLTEKLKPDKMNELIEQLNLYIASSGKKYRSHYHTILSWDNRSSSTASQKSNSNPCLTDEARSQYDNAF